MSAPNIQIICRCHTILGFLALTRRRCRPRICSLALPVSAPAYVCLCVYMCLCLHPIEWQNSMFKCVRMCVFNVQKNKKIRMWQSIKWVNIPHTNTKCVVFCHCKKKPARVEIMTNILSNECKNVKYTCLWNTIQQTLIKSTGKFTYVCVCECARGCLRICLLFFLILSSPYSVSLSKAPLAVSLSSFCSF